MLKVINGVYCVFVQDLEDSYLDSFLDEYYYRSTKSIAGLQTVQLV